MSLENIIPIQIWLKSEKDKLDQETGKKYNIWEIECGFKRDKAGNSLDRFKPSQIKSIGSPFLITSPDDPKIMLGDWVGWEMDNHLEIYLKRGHAEELIAEAKDILYLGYLEGQHHNLTNPITVSEVYTAKNEVKIVPCQFFHLIE